MYDRILLPTDGSEAVEAAVEEALALAARLDGVVVALHVVEPLYTVNEGLGSAYSHLERAGRDIVDNVVERGEVRGVSVEPHVTSGIPHQEILDAVEAHDCALVVMGTHGRTGLSRLLMGSVAERVVKLCDVPVLTVPPVESATNGKNTSAALTASETNDDTDSAPPN